MFDEKHAQTVQEVQDSRETPRIELMTYATGSAYERPVSPEVFPIVRGSFAEAGADQPLQFHLN